MIVSAADTRSPRLAQDVLRKPVILNPVRSQGRSALASRRILKLRRGMSPATRRLFPVATQTARDGSRIHLVAAEPPVGPLARGQCSRQRRRVDGRVVRDVVQQE